jgi:hypothetical protein
VETATIPRKKEGISILTPSVTNAIMGDVVFLKMVTLFSEILE